MECRQIDGGADQVQVYAEGGRVMFKGFGPTDVHVSEGPQQAGGVSAKRKKDERKRTGRKQIRIRCRVGQKDGRKREGRKQIRQKDGRKRERPNRIRQKDGRKREGRERVENRSRKFLRTLNVQHHWARLLLGREKSVEVRKYPLGGRRGEEHFIEETRGRDGGRGFKNAIVGTIAFSRDFQYETYAQFRSDEHRHRIPAGSSFDWDVATVPVLYGWEVEHVHEFVNPQPAVAVKGMIGAKAVRRRGTFRNQ